MPRCVLMLIIAFLSVISASAQVPEPTVVYPWELMLPSFLRVGYQTRAWVRDSLSTDSTLTDLDRVDLIYLRGLAEADGDIGLALAGAMFGVFEHATIPLRGGLELPLTLEPEDAFQRRVDRLPRALFADRPRGDDRDKLQHFFASAFLAHYTDSPLLADFIGNVVEWGEDAFVTGGVSDPRDVRANRLGQMFSELLFEYPHLLPSAVFRAWNKRWEIIGTGVD